jgi:hypothetical protein
MSTAEYYYPLATLNVRTDGINSKKYFIDASINAVNNTKINFAIQNGVAGTASEYYIQSISNDSDKTKFAMATKYLVIKHNIAGNCGTGNTCSANCEKISENSICTPKPFYVAFPLYIGAAGEDISKHLKSDRMNGRLAQSIHNLKDATTSVQFSLESVINAMKSFVPNGYYELNDKITNKKIYVMNKPIYIKNLDTSSFYGGDITIPPIITAPKKANINQVRVTRTCLKPKPKPSKTRACRPLFYGLAKKDQNRIDYLNLIYGLISLIGIFVFYYIYKKYLTGEKQTVLYGMILTLALVVIPIGITKGVYESKKGNVSVSDLQHSILFARYFILTILVSMVVTIVGVADTKLFFTDNFNYIAISLMMKNAFTNWTKEKWINLFIIGVSLFLISWSIYIFIPTPDECLL